MNSLLSLTFNGWALSKSVTFTSIFKRYFNFPQMRARDISYSLSNSNLILVITFRAPIVFIVSIVFNFTAIYNFTCYFWYYIFNMYSKNPKNMITIQNHLFNLSIATPIIKKLKTKQFHLKALSEKICFIQITSLWNSGGALSSKTVLYNSFVSHFCSTIKE